MEGEGSDRSDLRLPGVSRHQTREGDGGLIVDGADQEVAADQERSILRLAKANPNAAVILLNGAPIDMTAWIGRVNAVIEAWYPGEQGAKALSEILFGVTNPSAKLPICIPKSVGQLPLFYAHKPSGRGYAYCDNDGKPLFPFGFGLSYTSFAFSDAELSVGENGARISFNVTNTGETAGAQVAQLYLSSRGCGTVRPVKELKDYVRVFLQPGRTERVSLTADRDALSYYDRDLRFGLFNGEHTLTVGASSEDAAFSFEVRVQNGSIVDLHENLGDTQ